MAKAHPYKAVLDDELALYNLSPGEIRPRGKHFGYYFRLSSGRERFTVIPMTPSDGSRGSLNARGDLRKELAKHGEQKMAKRAA